MLIVAPGHDEDTSSGLMANFPEEIEETHDGFTIVGEKLSYSNVREDVGCQQSITEEDVAQKDDSDEVSNGTVLPKAPCPPSPESNVSALSMAADDLSGSILEDLPSSPSSSKAEEESDDEVPPLLSQEDAEAMGPALDNRSKEDLSGTMVVQFNNEEADYTDLPYPKLQLPFCRMWGLFAMFLISIWMGKPDHMEPTIDSALLSDVSLKKHLEKDEPFSGFSFQKQPVKILNIELTPASRDESPKPEQTENPTPGSLVPEVDEADIAEDSLFVVEDVHVEVAQLHNSSLDQEEAVVKEAMMHNVGDRDSAWISEPQPFLTIVETKSAERGLVLSNDEPAQAWCFPFQFLFLMLGLASIFALVPRSFTNMKCTEKTVKREYIEMTVTGELYNFLRYCKANLRRNGRKSHKEANTKSVLSNYDLSSYDRLSMEDLTTIIHHFSQGGAAGNKNDMIHAVVDLYGALLHGLTKPQIRELHAVHNMRISLNKRKDEMIQSLVEAGF